MQQTALPPLAPGQARIRQQLMEAVAREQVQGLAEPLLRRGNGVWLVVGEGPGVAECLALPALNLPADRDALYPLAGAGGENR